MKLFIVSFILFGAVASVGCNALVDSAPPSAQPVTHIEEYYLPLRSIGTSYAYCRKSSYGADTVWMTMQGNDASGLMLGNQACYATDMSSQTNKYLNNYYYAMNDSEAFTLGKVSCGNHDKYWLDLKTPLMVGQTWTFKNANGSYYIESFYTATVTRRGFQMKMPDGKIYDDVAEVLYTSKSDSTVKWFARGVGLIYSTSKKPDSDFGEEMRLVGQK